MQALSEVQQKLNAPKSQRNNFGKYNYRKAEDIIAAFKGLGVEGKTLTMSDEMSVVGGQIFLTATATFTAGGEQVSVTGCAMHAISKKGMDEAQITGAASSYARKYALCGLFAIDDSEHDPDAGDNRDKPQPPSKPKQEDAPQTPAQIRDSMKQYLSNQRNKDEHDNAKKDQKFIAAYNSLPEPMQNEIKAHSAKIEKKWSDGQ